MNGTGLNAALYKYWASLGRVTACMRYCHSSLEVHGVALGKVVLFQGQLPINVFGDFGLQ